MYDAFKVIEPVLPLPEGVEKIDLYQALSELYVRCSDLQNFHEAEQRQWNQTQRKFLLGLLEVADALDRISQFPIATNTDDVKKFLERQHKNIEATRRLLAQKLANAGVIKMELLGKVLDPATTDVEDDQDDDSVSDETVLRELISGYGWNQVVLRRARVIVSRHS